MPQKKTIKAKEIVSDIRAGMSDYELMEKYRLSVKGLQSIFQKLEEIKAIKRSELYGRSSSFDDTVNVTTMRVFPRNYMALALTVYEDGNPLNRGIVVDITEKGVGVIGIQAARNQTEVLVVDPGDLVDVEPITFSATCRWVRADEDGTRCGGFEIAEILPAELRKLRELIHELTLRG